jgi:hypothetical protein
MRSQLAVTPTGPPTMGVKCVTGCTCRRHSAPHSGSPRPGARTPVDLEQLRALAPDLSQQEIATKLGTTRKVIQNRMREADIEGHTPTLSLTYGAKHKRLRKARGKASAHQCVKCDNAALDWAQVHTEDGTDPWADYVPMCRSCHLGYDYDARWSEEPLAKWRAAAGLAIAAAWTPERRAAISQVAREDRLADPHPRDALTGRFVE